MGDLCSGAGCRPEAQPRGPALDGHPAFWSFFWDAPFSPVGPSSSSGAAGLHAASTQRGLPALLRGRLASPRLCLGPQHRPAHGTSSMVPCSAWCRAWAVLLRLLLPRVPVWPPWGGPGPPSRVTHHVALLLHLVSWRENVAGLCWDRRGLGGCLSAASLGVGPPSRRPPTSSAAFLTTFPRRPQGGLRGHL